MSVDIINHRIIKLPEYLTSSSITSFTEDINMICKDVVEVIYLDCALIEHATSSHINLLWEARHCCIEAGIKLLLINISMGLDAVLNVLDIKHFFNIISYADDRMSSNCLSSSNLIDKQVFSRKVHSDVKSINFLKKDLVAFLQGLKISQLCVYEIETIMYEILTNIRLHGKMNKEDKIEFILEINKEGMKLQVIDPGIPFDPTRLDKNYCPETAIKNKKKRGFGLLMIRKMTDNIYYERREDKLNILTVEKKARH